jgi:hypothetical protein
MLDLAIEGNGAFGANVTEWHSEQVFRQSSSSDSATRIVTHS